MHKTKTWDNAKMEMCMSIIIAHIIVFSKI